jgi:hypothetical protein
VSPHPTPLYAGDSAAEVCNRYRSFMVLHGSHIPKTRWLGCQLLYLEKLRSACQLLR